MEMLLVQADRATPSKHCASNPAGGEKPSWVQESPQVQLWLLHSPQGKLDLTFPRRLVQRNLETRCVGASMGL